MLFIVDLFYRIERFVEIYLDQADAYIIFLIEAFSRSGLNVMVACTIILAELLVLKTDGRTIY